MILAHYVPLLLTFSLTAHPPFHPPSNPSLHAAAAAAPADGDSQDKLCDDEEHMTFFQEEWEIPDGSKCIPGCFPDGQWCFQEGAGELGQCSFPPDQLCDCILRHEGGFGRDNNNEIVIDTSSVLADPANMIIGFFQGGMHDDAVVDAYEGFLRRYGLDRGTAAPLLRLDLEAGSSDGPFTLDESLAEFLPPPPKVTKKCTHFPCHVTG